METPELNWARTLEREGAWIFHTETGVVAKVTKLYDPDVNPYISPLNDVPVTAAVIECENGHTFLANPDCIIRLVEKEVAFFLRFQEGIAEVLRLFVQFGARDNIPPPTLSTLAIAVLREQMTVLQSGQPHLVRETAELMRHKEGDEHAEPEPKDGAQRGGGSS